MKKILIPVDTLELSEKMMEMARDLAEKFGSEIIILHVQPVLSDSFPPHLSLGLDYNGFHEISQQIVNNARSKFDGANIDSIRTHISEGNPASVIVDFAEHQQCDLILLSTHSLGSVRRFLLGSVTNKVVHHAKVPVLIVR